MYSKPRGAAVAILDTRYDNAIGDTAALPGNVLDALPAPTVLLNSAGMVVVTNSAWDVAVEIAAGNHNRGSGDVDYFSMVHRVCGPVVGQRIVDGVRAVSRGERLSVAVDFSVDHRDGMRWYQMQAALADPAGQVVVTHTDVTDRVLAEKVSTWRARHDQLTELLNRAALHELLDNELRRPKRALTVLFLDVDGFKDVNDSLGHEVGDDFLRQVADRLVARIGPDDNVARVGNDEFVIVCRRSDAAGDERLARRFQGIFDEPFDLGGHPTRLSASVGIASAPPGERAGLRAADLVRDAVLAMYAAKRAGRNNLHVFTPDLRDAVHRKIFVADELRLAIDTGQLVLHYQPILHLPRGRVAGVEALVRWQHPERGLLQPAEFIGLAEEYELMEPLTRWVLAAGTREAARWARRGQPLLLAVNVSATAVATGTLAEDVAQALAASKLPPDHLIVELTETMVANDPERAAAQFAALRISGVEVAIDDFGSGFSSLGQLVNIPAGILKIDRSLVTGAGDRQSQSVAAIAAVVALAKACGMRALAEGVETVEQLALAATLGCTFAQGFHIAGAMPADELQRWLKDWPVRRNLGDPSPQTALPQLRTD
ncbi:MAG: putative bifunctional diguanylate cyclase/phosphodiesterase [Frankiaceae bacterium]